MAGRFRVVHSCALCVLLHAAVVDVPPAFAADEVPAVEQKQRKLLANKLKLLDRLTANRPAVKRIEASDNSEAKALLQSARAAHEQASDLLAEGDLEGAGRVLDEGLKQAGAAARQVADKGREKKTQHQTYQQLRERILSFREAFERIIQDKGADSVAGLLDESRMNTTLVSAQKLVAKGDYGGANKELSAVANELEVALAKARHSETLIHELKFDTPTEELEYEQQRNKSHLMLVDLLKEQKKLSPSALTYLDKMVAHNENLREEAASLAKSGETKAAIKKLEQGTDSLMKALRANGMGM